MGQAGSESHKHSAGYNYCDGVIDCVTMEKGCYDHIHSAGYNYCDGVIDCVTMI
jgi:hypothetical protein